MIEPIGEFIVEPQDEIRRRAAYEARQMWRISEILTGAAPPAEADFDPGPKPQMISASEIAPKQIDWLWPGRIPLGMVVLFAGDPKLGKSLAALSLIAAVTRGGTLPGGDADHPATAPKGSVILLSGEDDWARTIVPRLLAAGADLDRVKTIPAMLEPEFRGFRGGPTEHVPACVRPPTASAVDLRAIERAAAELGDCRLIVFDPITAYIGRNVDVRRALKPLQDMAERLGVTVVLITHFNKQGASGTNAKYRVLGDIAYVAACRAGVMFLRDPDDPSGRRRLMLDNGANLADRQPALPYVVRDNGDGVARIEWLPETIDLDADAALERAVNAGRSGASGKGARRRECEGWLRGYLADGPKPATECERAAIAAGFTSSILHRARLAVAVRCLRSGFGKGACYHWCLPEAAIEERERADSAVGDHGLHIHDVQDMQDMHDMQTMGRPSNGYPPGARTEAAPVGDEVAPATESA